MVFVLITYTKIRTGGVGGYLKGLHAAHLRAYAVQHFVRAGDAHFHGVPSFRQHRVRQRHHGAGVCGAGNGIPRTVCVAAGAAGELLGSIPILQVGVPAVLSVYFDLFSSFMQAFIFCMLTTLYIANAADDS